jgi:hypothetical protein
MSRRNLAAVLMFLGWSACLEGRSADEKARASSYTRAELLAQERKMIPPEEVRADEWVNYQEYRFPKPAEGHVGLWAAVCPVPAYAETAGRAYLMLAITTEPFESARTQPVDVVVVLDRSGSMSEKNKITFAHQAILFLASQLTPTDRLGIVAFSSKAEVVRALSAPESQEKMKEVVEKITPTDNTNLNDGLTMGMKMLLENPRPASRIEDAPARRLLVITDGQANAGVTDTEEIVKGLQPGFTAGVRLSAIGVGLDYNDPLMSKLSRLPGNNGRFLESAAEINKSMIVLFDALLPVVVDKPDLRVTLPEGVKVVNSFQTETALRDGALAMTSLSSMGRDDHTVVLLEVEGTAEALAKVSGAVVTLSARDAAEQKDLRLSTKVRTAGAIRAGDETEDGLIAAAMDKATLVARAAGALRTAADKAQKKDFDGARQALKAVRSDIRTRCAEPLTGEIARVDQLLALDLDVVEDLAKAPPPAAPATPKP